MATVRAICTDALNEIGVLGEAESMSGPQGALALLRFQNQLDAWAADRLTFARQLRTTFVLTSGSASVTLGPSPSTVIMVAPLSLNHAAYLVPSASPAVESPIAVLDEDQYAAITIKALSSSLPQSCFYQMNLLGGVGTLTFWPVVSQNVTIALYTPEAVGVPVSLNTALTGPTGYAEAFMYQLALRLCGPFGVQPPPLLVDLAAKAFATVKRTNVRPSVLGVDPALTTFSRAGGYNVLSDQ